MYAIIKKMISWTIMGKHVDAVLKGGRQSVKLHIVWDLKYC